MSNADETPARGVLLVKDGMDQEVRRHVYTLASREELDKPKAVPHLPM